MPALQTLDDVRAALQEHVPGMLVRCTYRDAVTGGGLERIFPSYGIVTTHETRDVELLRRHHPVISLEHVTGRAIERVRGGGEDPLQNAEVRAAVRRLSPSISLLPYALSAQTHAVAVEEAWNVCAVDPDVREALDSRDAFLSIAEEASIPLPHTRVIEHCDRAAIEKFFHEHGSCVVQDLSEAAGLGTAFIHSAEDIERFTHGPARRAIAVFLDGLPVSCEGCVVGGRTVVSPPRLQIMGCPELGDHPALFCGSDWNVPMTAASRSALQEMTGRVRAVLHARGYAGIFGLDALWHPDTGAVHAIELNPRLLGTTQLYALQQALVGEPPVIGMHVLAFHGASCDVPDAVCRRIADAPCTASQVILRNAGDTAVTVRSTVEQGVYALENSVPVFLRPAATFLELEDDREFLVTMVPPAGKQIGPSAQLIRVQWRKACYDAASRGLLPHAAATAQWLRKHLDPMPV